MYKYFTYCGHVVLQADLYNKSTNRFMFIHIDNDVA